MVGANIILQIHNPLKIRNYRVFDIGKDNNYFDINTLEKEIYLDTKNKYMPIISMLKEQIEKNNKIKIALSISGTTLESFEKYSPDMIESLKKLNDTGCTEFVAEPFYHSLSFLYSPQEFRRQIELHKKIIERLFSKSPKIVRNTELIYCKEIEDIAEEFGFETVIAEDLQKDYSEKNFIYKIKGKEKLNKILNNTTLSKQITDIIMQEEYSEIDKQNIIEIFKNNTQKDSITTIFLDLKKILTKEASKQNLIKIIKDISENSKLELPSQNTKSYKAKEDSYINQMGVLSKLDSWMGNKMQKSAMDEIFNLEKNVKRLKDKDILKNWRMLTSSDHFFYMSTDYIEDFHNNTYQNPHNSPYDAYVYFMNILNDLIVKVKLKEKLILTKKDIIKEKAPKNILDKIKVAIKS